MEIRRLVLIAGVVPITVSAVRRVDASDPAFDADVAGYGGTSTGGWTCGPRARVRYAGAAANALIAERRAASGRAEGAFAMMGGAAEHEQVTILPEPCDSPLLCPRSPNALPTRFLYGAHARIGYGESTFALHVGLMGFQGWTEPTSTRPSLGWCPEIELKFGNLDGAHGLVGLGAPTVTMLRRPGLYGGFGYASDSGWGIDLRTGIYRSGPSFDLANFRADLVGRVPITKQIDLRGGVAVAEKSKTAPEEFDYELSVGPSFSF